MDFLKILDTDVIITSDKGEIDKGKAVDVINVLIEAYFTIHNDITVYTHDVCCFVDAVNRGEKYSFGNITFTPVKDIVDV